MLITPTVRNLHANAALSQEEGEPSSIYIRPPALPLVDGSGSLEADERHQSLRVGFAGGECSGSGLWGELSRVVGVGGGLEGEELGVEPLLGD